MEKRQHSVSKLIRMTPAEAKELSEHAAASGMTETQFIRNRIKDKPLQDPELKAMLKELINEVNRIGVNINQIAKSSNAGFYSDADRQILTAYMRKLNLSVKKVVDGIGNQ